MDQGENFKSKLVQELCDLTQVQKLCTTPYRPKTNGACERFNLTLINMLGTHPSHVKSNWQDWVATMTHVYNCILSFAMGFSPYFCMFGRHAILPIDINFRFTNPCLSGGSHKTYIQKLRAWLHWAYKAAANHNRKEAQQHKWYYDEKYKCMELSCGDLVLVRVQVPDPDCRKITDKWKQSPYKVISKFDKSVLRVQEVGNESNIHNLHGNMLFPLMTED